MERASTHPSLTCKHEKFTSLLDNETKKKILCLAVHCSEGQCTWSGGLKKLENHQYSRHALRSHLTQCPKQPLQKKVRKQIKVVKQQKQKTLDDKLSKQESMYKKGKNELLQQLQIHGKKYERQLQQHSLNQSKKLDDLRRVILAHKTKRKKHVLKLKKHKNQCRHLQVKLYIQERVYIKELHNQLLGVSRGNFSM